MRRMIVLFVALAAIVALSTAALAQEAGYEPPPLPTDEETPDPPGEPPRPVPPPSRDIPPRDVPPPVTPPRTPLAATGLATEMGLVIAAALVLAGVGMVFATRRRKDVSD